jgi:DNA mismatch endonuclease (patch repair protein)
VRSLPGCPDIVFRRAKLAVFCDGDFWHGYNWIGRKAKLVRGANARYWMAKIEGNMERDINSQLLLESKGWRVLRFWESEIAKSASAVLGEIEAVLDGLE